MFGPLVLGFVGGVVSSLLIMAGVALSVRRAVQRSPLGRMMSPAKPAPGSFHVKTPDGQAATAWPIPDPVQDGS